MSEVKQPESDDEKARQLGIYRRKLNDYREVETKLKDLRKKVSPDFATALIYPIPLPP